MFLGESFNVWSIFSMFILPLSLLGLGSLIISKKGDLLDSLIIGSSVVIIILSVWALIVPFGFKEIAWLIFLIGVYGCMVNWLKFKKDIAQLTKSYSLSRSDDSLLVTVSKGLVLAFIFKLILFVFFRPTIDPDVIQYYLPFARSLLRSGRFPSSDFYTGIPLNNISIGSLVLYGYSLAIGTAKNITSFKLIPATFIVGIGIYWFKFVKKLSHSQNTAWLTLAVLVSLPLADSILFETLFYPDYLFALLFLYFVNFVIKPNKNCVRSVRSFTATGIIISSMLLTKFQAILVIPLSVGFFISVFLKGRTRKTLIILFAFLIFSFRLFNHLFFRSPNFIDFILSPLIIIYLLSKILPLSFKVDKQRAVKVIVWVFIIVLVGGVWWWRNLILFNNFFGEIGVENYWASSVVNKVIPETAYYQTDSFLQKILNKINLIQIPRYIQPKFVSLAVMFWSVMGSFWLIPKIAAFLMKKNQQDIKLAYWFIGWYLIWIFYLGGVSSRHLFNIYPILAYFVSKGLVWTSTKVFKTRVLQNRFIVIYLLSLSLVSLVQSRFLSWNLGTIIFGQVELHQVAREVVGSDSLTQTSNTVMVLSDTIYRVKKYLTVINLSGYPASRHFLSISGISIIVSSILLIISYFTIKKKKLNFTRKSKSKMGIIIATIFFAPYLTTILILGKGDLFKFAQAETQRVYTYGGQFNKLIPYLNDNLSPSDKVILLAPTTGLPYYLNHPVVDVLNTYEIKKLRPVLKSSDHTQIEAFIKNNRFRYLVIREDKQTLSEVQNLQNKFTFFQELTKLDTIKQIIRPDSTSSWSLYKLY